MKLSWWSALQETRAWQQWISVRVPFDAWLQVVSHFCFQQKEVFITVCLPRPVPVFMAFSFLLLILSVSFLLI